MAIGDALTNSAPAVGSAGTGYATSVNALLTEIKTLLEQKIPFTSLSGAVLDMANVPITNAQYVTLIEGATPPLTTPLGQLARYQNNLYWVTDEGVLRITNGLTLDATSLEGITGDYGPPNPAEFKFVDATQSYVAFDDAGTNALGYVDAAGFYVSNSYGGNTVLINNASSGNYTLLLPVSLPSSGRSILTVDSAGQLGHAPDTGAISNSFSLGTDVNITLTGTGKIKQGDRRLHLGQLNVFTSTGAHTPNPGFIISGVAGTYYLAVHGWQENYRYKSMTVHFLKNDAATMTVSLEAWNAGALATTAATNTTTTNGAGTVTATAGTPNVIASTDSLLVKITTAANNDRVYAVELVYDIV